MNAPLQISAGCMCYHHQRSKSRLAGCLLLAESFCPLWATVDLHSSARLHVASASWGHPKEENKHRHNRTKKMITDCLALQVPPPAVCGPWQWEPVGACRSGHSSPGGQSPVASSVVNPPQRSSGGEEHEGRTGTTESAPPSAPAWTGRNKRSVCFYLNK